MEAKLLFILLLSSLFEFILNKVTIISPKALKQQFTNPIKASYSNFGKIPYGYTLSGRIYFDPDNIKSDMACEPIETIKIPKNPSVDQAPIVMIDRGNCTFVKKVKNVENIGGHLALIIENVDGEDPSHIIMSDDQKRQGENIHIPAVLIGFEDGKKIKDFYRKNKDNPDTLKRIIIEVQFEMEHNSNTVNYSIYFSSEYFNIYKTLKELYHYHVHLDNSTTLKPYYVSNYNKYFTNGNEVDNCYSSGRYCITPRYDLNISDGRQILRENLRQKCIYKYAYETAKNSSVYWNYMGMFYDDCIGNGTEAKNFTEMCATNTMIQLNVNYLPVHLCIIDSFGIKDINHEEKEYLTKDNEILKHDIEVKNNHNIWLIPTILINNRTFWGNWNGENIFEALCAAYKIKPQVCYDEGAFFKENNTGMSYITIAIITVIVIIINLVIFLVCRNWIKRKIADKVEATDINNKINSVVTSYISLKDAKETSSSN